MWIVILITLVNSLADSKRFVETYRISLGGAPINVFDIMLTVGLLAVALRLFVATTAGIAVAATDEVPLYNIVAITRNYVTLPAAALIGFHGPRHERDYDRYVWTLFIGGVGVSLLILLFFTSKGSELGAQESLVSVRAVQYVSNYATFGACLFVIAAIRRAYLPVWLALVAAAFCFVGQVATLARSEWLACLAALLVMVFQLERRFRLRVLLVGTVATVGLVLALWGGLAAVSTLTGRDWTAAMEERTLTLLPGERQATERKAWDTRLPGAMRELELFASSPLWGRGLGIQDAEESRHRYGDESWRHNTFTSFMAETGVLGLSGILVALVSMGSAGWRLRRHRARGISMVGSLGVIAPVFYAVLGLGTMSFNQMRWAIPLMLTFGVVMRASLHPESLATGGRAQPRRVA